MRKCKCINEKINILALKQRFLLIYASKKGRGQIIEEALTLSNHKKYFHQIW